VKEFADLAKKSLVQNHDRIRLTGKVIDKKQIVFAIP
jgi:hypothetical protein